MRKPILAVWVIPVLLSLWGLAGCDSNPPPLAPVNGHVKYQGQPLSGGTIVFTPDPARGSRGPIALGKIDAQGKFTLYTKSDPGAVAGWHRVTIVAMDEPSNNEVANSLTPPRLRLPPKYQSPDTSGLYREVKISEPNIIDFELD
jgi:hypothetical protein